MHLTLESKSHEEKIAPTSPGIKCSNLLNVVLLGTDHLLYICIIYDYNIKNCLENLKALIKHTHLNSGKSLRHSFKIQLQYSLNQEKFARSVIISFDVLVFHKHITRKYPILHCVVEKYIYKILPKIHPKSTSVTVSGRAGCVRK